MKKFTLAVIMLSFLTVVSSFAQTDDVQSLLKSGIGEHDKGNYEKAIEYYEKALEIEPENEVLIYEKAWSYFAMKNYPEVISLLSERVESGDVNSPELYSLLGSAYDDAGNPEKSIPIYRSGLEKFPNSGRLYTNYGITVSRMSGKKEGLKIFEEGIEKDPSYRSNFYFAAKTHHALDQKIWALIYGETFINLEPSTKRTKNISKMMYNIYKGMVSKGSEDGERIKHFNITFNSKSMSGQAGEQFAMEYETAATVAMLALLNKELDLNGFVEFRDSFAKIWIEGDYPANIIFERQKEVMNAGEGYLTVYNYFILSGGNMSEFEEAIQANSDLFMRFADWMDNHPMKISKSSKYCREQYK